MGKPVCSASNSCWTTSRVTVWTSPQNRFSQGRHPPHRPEPPSSAQRNTDMAAQANPFTENLGRHRYPVSSSCMTGQKDDRDERFRLVFDMNLSRVVDYAHRRLPAHDADDVVSNG